MSRKRLFTGMSQSHSLSCLYSFKSMIDRHSCTALLADVEVLVVGQVFVPTIEIE